MRHAWMLLLPALVGLSTSAHHGHGQEKKEEKKEAPKTGKGTVYLSDVKMAYTWTIESESEGPLHSIFECDNPCQGKKHAKHEDCDLTCDGKCGAIHQHEPYILVESNDLKDVDEKGAKPKKGNDAQMGADFSSFGVAGAVTASETAREIFQGLVRDCGKKWDKPIKVDHFNKTPCSSQKASIHYRRWVVSIDYELLYTKKEGDKTTVEHGPKRKLWWEFTVEPSNDDDRTLTYADPVIDCRCEVKQTKNHDMSFDGWQDEYAHIGAGPDVRHPGRVGAGVPGWLRPKRADTGKSARLLMAVRRPRGAVGHATSSGAVPGSTQAAAEAGHDVPLGAPKIAGPRPAGADDRKGVDPGLLGSDAALDRLGACFPR